MSRWLKLILVVLGAVGVLVATLPWWLGVVLRPVLRAQQVTFKDYERVGYTHFRLHHAAYTGAGFSVGVEQLETVTPVVWLWQRMGGANPVISAEKWQVVRTARPSQPSSPTKIRGLPDLRAAAERIVPRLFYWLPHVQLKAGEVRGFGPDFTLARLNWQKEAVTGDGLGVAGRQFAFALTPAASGAVTLTAHTPENDARLRLVSTGAELTGEAVWWDQTLQLAARFPAAGWLPAEASAIAENWRLPAARVKLGVPYVQVLGGGRLLWRDGAFDLTLDAQAEPAVDAKKKAPPFAARAAAHGTLRELTVTVLDVNAPFATAKLTAPVTFGVDRPLAAESARLTVQADLTKLPWIEARGQAEGTVTVQGGTAAARQDFALKFSDVAVRDFSVKAAQARGTLAWPRMELSTLNLQLDDTSSLEAHGSVDWQTRELAGLALEAKLASGWLARWLPKDTTWTNAEIAATVEGPLTAPRHQGSLKLAEVRLPPLQPIALTASWQGTGAEVEITALATAKKSTLEFAGTLARHGLLLTRLKLSPGGEAGLELTAPSQLNWSPVWQVNALALTGPSSQLTVKGHGGPTGSFAIAASHFPSSWLQDWVALTGPGWQIDAWQANGRIENGGLVFDTTLTAKIEVSPQPAEVSVVAHGDARGLELKEFKVMSGGRALTQATGRLPLVWLVEPTTHFVFDETAPLELSATTEADSPLWATLAASTGVQLVRATAKADLKGTLRKPAGDLQVNVAQLSVAPGRYRFNLPEFTDLDLGVQFGRERVTVRNFTGKIDGQSVQASGEFPMDDDRWQQLWRAPATFDWREAEARVEIPDADLAPLAQRFPDFVAAHGRLRARVELARGGKFSGELHLTDAASRPLPVFGTLQQIQADLRLDDRTLTVDKLTATLGGEPVTLEGNVALDPDRTPRLALALKGKNLPLVRNTGLLLRADLDLHADTPASGPTRLSGTIAVRDCLVLANVNLQTLLPSGRRGVTRQPPYFAVEAAPFNQWPLAVAVRAPGAVRVRTTVYNGTASAQFQLGGTLGEPRAVGELTVDQGQVLFPFATFKVQQGTVRLREADPFHAVVSLNATSQRRDYQLRLEMTGELPAPNLVLTSTPAMEAEDVLLMVMTGQPPANASTATTASGPRLAMIGAYLGRGLFQDLGFGGEDRLEISAGERISRDGRETYEFEYKLGGRWSLLGEYDRFDSYNAGLKWRAYTEESVPNEKK
jgi:translocation and assembly module TamB